MSGLVIFLVAIAAIVVFDILAQTYGVDSRPESEDPRAPIRGLTS